MGIAGWLTRLLKDDDAESGARAQASSLPAEPHEEAASGLNFRTAIEAHQKWKMRLQAVIESKSQEALDPAVVCRDDQCDLGKWIHGVGGRQFASDAQFVDLRGKHARFHACAGRVLSLAQSGKKEQAVAEMSEFGSVSREVVGDLASLFMRLKEARS